jgi:protein phosphatase 1 regulatory subunit 7
LTELYLSENGIEKIENLESNRKLDTLDLAKNRIKKIEGINHLEELQELWLNDNQISEWKCVDNMKQNKKLETVYLERNPIAQDVQYRKKLVLAIPWLQKIDATLCQHLPPMRPLI